MNSGLNKNGAGKRLKNNMKIDREGIFMKKIDKKELEKEIILKLYNRMPRISVYLKRLPNEMVDVYVMNFKGKVYIYDAFANKYYSMKHYGKTWALIKEELL